MRNVVDRTATLVIEVGDVVGLMMASLSTSADNMLTQEGAADERDRAREDLIEAMYHLQVSRKNWIAKVRSSRNGSSRDADE